MTVLSAAGTIQVGPLAISAPVPAEAHQPSISWSGSTYLMATRFGKCADGDPLCHEDAVVVSRLRVKPASNSVEFASSFGVGTVGWQPGHPTLDGVFMAWDERPEASADPGVVHLEELDQEGLPIGTDHVVSTEARPLARAFVGSTPVGKLVGWAEDGDTGLSDQTVGRSVLRIQPMRRDLGLEGTPVTLPMTRFVSMGWPAAVPLDYPRGVLVAWAARSRTTLRYSVFLQFLPCAK